MSELLASCAAASAVSTPPAEGGPGVPAAEADAEAEPEGSAHRARHRAHRPVTAR
ncbi:hypothetical protein [Streptomyces fuscigenes]|uniref:hypothetical protein n=1 Tax=Streptomyces fuscigenes TaxID=1528880 RepID=UPI001F27F709|nr:hypothetical protein [Streptomyces fuscigenes]MCF3964423.1 hypothetical protein [Streptomyces fuscigenes]